MRKVRNSERQSWLQCRLQHWWAYVKMLEPNRVRPALELGTLVHKSMEMFQCPGKKRGPHPAEVAEQEYKRYLKKRGNDHVYVKIDYESDDDPVTIGDLAVEMLTNYVDEYGQDEWMEVLAPELAYQVIYPDSRGRKVEHVGTIDNCIRDLRSGKIGFKENKTSASLEVFGAPLTLNEQGTNYWAFAPEYLRQQKLLGRSEEVDFIMYDILRKAFRDTRPQNANGEYLNKPKKDALEAECERRGIEVKRMTIETITGLLVADGMTDDEILLLGEVSSRQPPPLFRRERIYKSDQERALFMDRVAQQTYEMHLTRTGRLPVYKTTGTHCKFCGFKDMCELHEIGGDWESYAEVEMHTWKPYSEHEIMIERKH